MTSTAARSGVAQALGAGAIALAAMILTAPAAYALTEQQIKDECKAAGGTYSTTVTTNGRDSSCCYKDYKGKTYCDWYYNGQYEGTTPNEPGTPTPTVQPVQPPPPTIGNEPGTPLPVQPAQPPPPAVAPVIP